MTRHRTIFSTLLLVAFMAAPSGAQAGSLLSGYGGPGGGAQAILGSTLVNGSGGGSGGSEGGGAAGGGSSLSAGGGASSTGTPSGAQAGGGTQGKVGGRTGTLSGAQADGSGAIGSRQASGVHPGGATRGATNTETSRGASSAYSPQGSPRIVAGASAADDMGVLSFTGTDLLLLLLVLGVLVVTAGLTRRLAGTRRYS